MITFSRRLLAAALIAGVALHASAQTRPKVGLVLGGGGARGGAHMGVLEVLEEMRIPFDCVAGTSMGALVSGAYLAGVSPVEMKEKIKATDWAGMFDDNAGRENVGVRTKQLDDRFFSALEFGVTKEGLRYREGAVAGTKIKLFFNSLVRADLGERSIEDLPLPLTLIATDIGTGERVAMRSGNLTTAMRASMSVPGAVAPVLRDGHKLVDGGLVDNVPIQEVRDRCGAEAVIAINVGSPLMKPEEVTGLVSIVGQMVNLLTEQNVARSLALLGPRDVYMHPELGSITAMDFDRQMEAADIGRRTALAAADSLRRYSVPQAEYDAWRAKLRSRPPQSAPRIDAIEIADTRYVNKETLADALHQKEGEPLDTAQLERDLVILRSAGDLTTVDYSVLPERDKTILRITPVEKTLGPDYLRFGMNLYSDFRGEATYNIRAMHRRTWLNSLGGEWIGAFQVGNTQGFFTEFYQPLEPRQTWFVRPYAAFTTTTVGLFDNGDRVAEYKTYKSQGGFEAGMNFGPVGLAKIGWRETNARASVETGAPILPSNREVIGGPSGSLSIDTLDFAFFPTRGVKLDVDVFDAQHLSGSLAKYGTAEARFNGAWTVGDFILVGAAQHGESTHGTLPVSDLYSLGGPRHLAGLAPSQILGDGYSYASAEVQYKLTKAIPLLGLQLIAGIQAEVGRMRKPVTEPSLTGWQPSYGLYLAANSAFGPIYLGWADAKNARGGRFYFFVGTP